MHVAEEFRRRGHTVAVLDIRGHGRSEGRRGHLPSFRALLGDLDRFERAVSAETPPAQLFVIGQSLGGLAALLWVIEGGARPAGLVLASPALLPQRRVTALEYLAARAIAAIAPRLKVRLRTRAELFTSDPEMQRLFQEDPLNHRTVTVGFGVAFLRETRRLLAGQYSLSSPCLFLVGDRDRVSRPEGASRLFGRIACEDKTIRVLPGFRHGIFQERGWDAVVSQASDWIEERLDRSA